MGNSNTQLTQTEGETEGKIRGFDTDIEGETIKEANPDVQKAMRLF